MANASFPEVVIHRRLGTALRLFNQDRLRWLGEAAQAGPVSCLRFGLGRAFVVTDPDVARSMLIGDSASWTRPAAVRTPIRLAVGDNLFAASDKVWAMVQPAVSPAFRRRALDERIEAADDIVDDEIAHLPLGRPIDLDAAMGRIALVYAAWVLLGDRLDRSRADLIAAHQQEVIAWVAGRIGSLTSAIPLAVGRPSRRMRPHAAVLAEYAAEVIDKRRSHPPGTGPDILDALLAARPNGRPLEPGPLTSHVLGLLLAGNETTAAALSWTLVHAAAHPQQWDEAADPAAAEHYIAETMRLTPSVWGLAHQPARRGAELPSPNGPVPIPRSSTVTTYLYGINRDPVRWDDPLAFRPSRHRAATADQRQSLLTFGLGPRGCIGQHLALAELHSVVPRLARRATVTIDGRPEATAAFSLRVRGGLNGTLGSRPPDPAQSRMPG